MTLDTEQRVHAQEAPHLVAQGAPVPLVAPAVPPPLPSTPDAPLFADRAWQRQAAGPLLDALGVRRQVDREAQAERAALQQRVSAVQAGLPEGAQQTALQRRVPQVATAADHVGLYRYEAHLLQASSGGGYTAPGRWPAIQRRAVDGLVRTYQHLAGPPAKRRASFGRELAALRRLPFGETLVGSVLGRVPGAMPCGGPCNRPMPTWRRRNIKMPRWSCWTPCGAA